jgi:zinc/manganese transport system substrate-binding protein/manganese/iron transport system substrate-binding protein
MPRLWLHANRTACVLSALLLSLALTACGNSSGASDSNSSAAPDALKVVATTTQIADMTRAIGGQLVKVNGLLPANADPHDFEPTPRDVGRIADARLVLEHGLKLDAWSGEMVKVSGTHATIVVVTSGVQTLASDEEGFDQGDPHVWFNVANAKVMAANIRDALIAADPTHRDAYTTQAAAYLTQLDELDSWIRQQIATIPSENRKLVTTHDAFGYYVSAYGLELAGTVMPGLDTQAEPSAKSIAALVDTIRAQHVKAIFTEASLNPKLERQIADEAGVAIVDNLYGDALGPAGSGADTYIGMMRTDTTLIVDALR